MGVGYTINGQARLLYTTRIMQPEKASIAAEYDKEWSWAVCQEFVEKEGWPAYQPPMHFQAGYAQEVGICQESKTLSDMYAKWSMSAETQLLSRAAEGEETRPRDDIIRAMGRGQGPRFRTKPICPRKGPQEYRIHRGLNELHGLKALIDRGKHSSTPPGAGTPTPA